MLDLSAYADAEDSEVDSLEGVNEVDLYQAFRLNEEAKRRLQEPNGLLEFWNEHCLQFPLL